MMKPHVVIWMTHQKVRIRAARSASRGLSDTRSPIVLHHILHNLDFNFLSLTLCYRKLYLSAQPSLSILSSRITQVLILVER
jgi:hypothetical protein